MGAGILTGLARPFAIAAEARGQKTESLLRQHTARMQAAASSTPVRQILAQAGARITPAREAVLDILLASTRALSHQEVEQAARERGLNADRVTLYRVLDWLVTQRLAHKIEGRDRIWRFNAVAAAEHAHAHFHCTRCGRVFCLEQALPSLIPNLPPGFRFERVELTVQGLCPHCAAE